MGAASGSGGFRGVVVGVLSLVATLLSSGCTPQIGTVAGPLQGPPAAPTTGMAGPGRDTLDRPLVASFAPQAPGTALGPSSAGTAGSAWASQAATIALSQQGKPYSYGAEGPSSFDCSGLVQYAFGNAGVSLPRTTDGLSQAGAPVSANDLRIGDLVFFRGGGHVGIYVGQGQYVHAPQTGDVVRIANLSDRAPSSIRRVA